MPAFELGVLLAGARLPICLFFSDDGQNEEIGLDWFFDFELDFTANHVARSEVRLCEMNEDRSRVIGALLASH